MGKSIIVGIFVTIVLVLCFVGLPFGNEEPRVGVSTFQTKEDLNEVDEAELDRILDIESDFRTASESQWLTRRAIYIYNEIIDEDDAGNILEAQGQTLPTGYSGFSKGAIFRIVDTANNLRGMYENTGTTSAAIWKAVGLQSTVVTLASAQFDTLGTTPVELVADPGDGKVAQLVSVTGYRFFASESWNTVTDGIEVKYDGASGLSLTASFSKGFADGGSTSSTASPSYQTRWAIDVNNASPSEAIYLTTGTNPAIDGDTYFKFDVQYLIVELP